MNIIEAIHNESMFKPCFRDLTTWRSWLTLLKALFGLPMDKDEISLFKRCTGRDKPPEGEFREFWGIVGRRGGKSYISALVAVYLALFYSYKDYLSAGESGVVQIIAADRSQAQVILGYIKGILHSNPVFEQYIAAELKESIDLSNSISIEVMSCSYRSIRGRTVVCALFDEISFWRVEGANPDKEILGAIRPAMATIPNSKLIVISSPYARSGILYEHYRDYFGQDDPDILIWQAETRLMNSTISQELIERERKKDASAARAEWDAEFRDDIETFLDPEIISQCAVLPGSLSPNFHTVYRAFADPSGGRADAFTLAIGHPDAGRLTVDLLRGWKPPFNPESVVEEIAEILTEYRISRIVGDRYAGAWVESAFQKQGIVYEACDKPKSDLYLAFEGNLNTRRVELPNDEQLITELVNLERKRGRSGRDVVDHPPRGSDDLANAIAGVCYVLSSLRGSFFADCYLPTYERKEKACLKN